MQVDALIRMANQIGEFFEAAPDRTEALEGIAQHLRRYWEPRMRRELLAHMEGHGSAGLNSALAEAIGRHRCELGQPVGAEPATFLKASQLIAPRAPAKRFDT